jgi:outer membrane receptor for Fe3+-dicitrate
MSIVDLTRRANRLGIDTGNDKPLMLTEQQQIRNYMSKNDPRFDAGNQISPNYNYYPYDNEDPSAAAYTDINKNGNNNNSTNEELS